MPSLAEELRLTSNGAVMADRLPTRYAHHRLAGYDPKRDGTAAKAKTAAERFAAGEGGGLVLVGNPGSGKTHLAAAVCNAIAADLDVMVAGRVAEWERRHAEWDDAMAAWLASPHLSDRPAEPWKPSPVEPRMLPAWVNVPESLADMRRQFGGEPEAADRLRSLASLPGVVVLDDLGREKASDWTGEVVYTLVNARYEELLRTIVTSNLTLAELAETSYWPVISRLAEDGFLVELKAPDERLARRIR